MTQCRALGCLRQTSAFGVYCSTHGSRRRKNGHEDQRSIRATQLNPYLAIVQARRAKNPDNPTWAALVARWSAVVDEATVVVGAYEAGKPTMEHKRLAAEEIGRLAETVDTATIIDTSLAMVVFWQLVPRTFMSDQAFQAQLVRRVVRLSPSNAVTYTGSNRPKRAYRDLSPKVMEVLSTWLLAAFGAAGLKMAELETRDRAEADRISRELNQGLEDMS